MNSADRDELFDRIFSLAVETVGLKLAWIAAPDGDGGPRQVAAAGTAADYLKDIRISVDGGDQAGRGPTGTALRENRPAWCQDFQNDPTGAR